MQVLNDHKFNESRAFYCSKKILSESSLIFNSGFTNYHLVLNQEFIHMCSVTHWCPTLCNPMDCSLPGSSVHGIIPAKILEWVAISSSRDLFDPGIVCDSCIGRQMLYQSQVSPNQEYKGKKLWLLLYKKPLFQENRCIQTLLPYSYANVDISPQKGKQLLVIYGKVAMLNPQQVYFLLCLCISQQQ